MGPRAEWPALTLTGATAAAGLSLAVMALFPKPEHVDGAGGAIFNILAFLGGLMTPLHVLPEWFRTSLAWLPNRAVLAGYLKASRGAEPAAVSGELTTLAAAAAGCLPWGGWRGMCGERRKRDDGVLRRIGVMIGLNTRRTFSSPGNVLGSHRAHRVQSHLGGVFRRTGRSVAGDESCAEYETPRGGTDGQGLVKLRITFGIYLVFTLAALFGRGGALHQEHKEGTLQRLVAVGVAYGEIVAADVATIFLVGAVQAAVFVSITAAVGHAVAVGRLERAGLDAPGDFARRAGLAVCLSGLTRSAPLMQGLSAGVPPLLAMVGGALFPLEAAPLGLQQAARINPVFWAVELLDEGYVYRGVPGQILPLTVLLLIGVLGAVIGIQGLRRVESVG